MVVKGSQSCCVKTALSLTCWLRQRSLDVHSGCNQISRLSTPHVTCGGSAPELLLRAAEFEPSHWFYFLDGIRRKGGAASVFVTLLLVIGPSASALSNTFLLRAVRVPQSVATAAAFHFLVVVAGTVFTSVLPLFFARSLGFCRCIAACLGKTDVFSDVFVS